MPLPAKSSPVSPRRRDIGEVASLRAEGVERQPQSGFSARQAMQTCCNVDPIRTPPPTAPPLPRYRATEENIATFSNLAIQFLYLLCIRRKFVVTAPISNRACYPKFNVL